MRDIDQHSIGFEPSDKPIGPVTGNDKGLS
jgi:hypothetical protein